MGKKGSDLPLKAAAQAPSSTIVGQRFENALIRSIKSVGRH